MPIYEFECRKCGERFEKLCSMSANTDEIACPGCDQLSPRKLVSGFFAQNSSGSIGGSSCGCGGSCGKSSCAGCSH